MTSYCVGSVTVIRAGYCLVRVYSAVILDGNYPNVAGHVGTVVFLLKRSRVLTCSPSSRVCVNVRAVKVAVTAVGVGRVFVYLIHE